jgi:hypothetical protein
MGMFGNDVEDLSSKRRLKNSWKEAVDRDSIAPGIENWQAITIDLYC